jgi:plastocyanin
MLKAFAFTAALLIAPMAQAATVTVTIDNYAFTPEKVTVHPGDTVIWQNKDSAPHTATALDGKSFDSGAMDPGGSWSFAFKTAGVYEYRCSIHPDMRGTITVR